MHDEQQPEGEMESALEQALESLPSSPGVYLMKDTKGKVLYVGKAVNLRQRVRSYFRESGDSRLNVQFLRSKVADVETVVTSTEKEALLLENIFIKKHQPRYNIRLRDDKTYISLRLDIEHEWPRIHRIRKRRGNDRAIYFGPFSSSHSVKETLRFLQRLFPLRSCPDQVLRNRTRPCILHQIDRCSAPCVNLVSREKYQEYVDQTALFFQGRRDEVLDLLRRKMWEYSESMEYEKAAVVRDRVLAVERTIEAEVVSSHRAFDRDVVALQRERGRVAFAVVRLRGGSLVDTSTHFLRDPGFDDAQLMEDFLTQLYDGAQTVPRDILLAVEPMQTDLLKAALESMRGGPVRLAVPQRGEKARLIELARRNAEQELQRRLAGERSRDEVLTSLRDKLKLPIDPRRIECFDISNFQGSFSVGSMTCFVDGEPEKSGYRRFKIRTVEGQNDFAMMREVLLRRYGRMQRESTERPDLIVIDGGKGQLNAAIEALREIGLLGEIPICGLAKARLKGGRGRDIVERTEERVFLPNRKDAVRFDQSDPALYILTRIRDEAHRFGIEYHRKLRNSASLKSGLEEIPGVGPKRRRVLLTHFGSLLRLKGATEEEIAAVPGITAELASQIYRHLQAPRAPAEVVEEESEDYGEDD